MHKLKLLVVDDDELVHDTFALCLPEHWSLQAIGDFKQVGEDFHHAAFVDMHLTGDLKKAEGVDVIAALSKAHPQLEIIAMSGDLDRTLMEQCLKAGASRFLAKPVSKEEVQRLLDKVEALWQLRGVGGPSSRAGVPWIGSSAASEDVRKFISQMAGESSPILLEGESGVGKEVVAQWLRRSGRPFVAVNVAAIPEDLFESEFFGHTKGAFTGAVQNCMGFAEQAHGGDLFLDEIEALPMPHQAKLLRFLESGEYKRVGDREFRKADIRIIAATNEDLSNRVQGGSFRKDLLFRLSGHHFVIPSLRERVGDIKELCQYFSRQQQNISKKSFSQDAIEKLSKYSWPGNVRELKRVVEQLCVRSPLPVVRGEDVQELLFQRPQEVSGDTFHFNQGLGALMQGHERKILSAILEDTEDVEEIIAALQISRSSLYKKLKDHNLELKRSV